MRRNNDQHLHYIIEVALNSAKAFAEDSIFDTVYACNS